MKSLGELRLVRGMDEATRQWIPLFVYAVSVPKSGKKYFTHLQSTLFSRLAVPLCYRKGHRLADVSRSDAQYIVTVPLFHKAEFTTGDGRTIIIQRKGYG